jgi:hypothetical protein
MKRKHYPIIAGIVLLAFSPALGGGGFSYDDYAAVLSAYVDDEGLVDYAGLSKNRGNLDAFATALAKLDGKSYDRWSEWEKVAFWINVYNGLTLQLIVDHYPIESSMIRSIVFPKSSIMQIPGAWKKVTFEVMGEHMTLDSIEHEILRARFDEPRIHMALVCAALSCPILRNEPYRAQRLEEQLNDQAGMFLENEKKFRIDRDGGVVRLSKIFDWFAEDFVDRYGTGDPPGKRSEKTQAVLNFIRGYLNAADAQYLATGDYRVKHLKYDWTLNEKPDA